jgi:hypothetical protein
MNRNVHQQLEQPRGVDTRFASTANLFVDSLDRNTFNYSTTSGLKTGSLNETGSDFTINSLQNSTLGEFTRIAVQEVCMDWGVPNIAQFRAVTGFNPTTGLPNYGGPIIYDNSTFSVNVSGVQYDVSLNSGFYNVAQVMTAIVVALNAKSIPSATFSLSGDDVNGVLMYCSTKTYYVVPTSLSIELGFLQTTTPSAYYYPGEILAPNIMPWTYVDITCQQLTYCQDVKDATTNPIKRDVMYRWYLADNTGLVDKYGFPILTGYMNFHTTRLIGFPKQIKWEPIQQVSGTLNFVSYANLSTGSIQSPIANFEGTPYNTALGFGSVYNYEFRMTLLLSEI